MLYDVFAGIVPHIDAVRELRATFHGSALSAATSSLAS
jgi:hypothetical protein